VIITSYLFPEGRFSQERLDAVLAALGGDKSNLVIDLSCRRRGEDSWFVAMNKWQTITDMEVNQGRFPFRSVFLTEANYPGKNLYPSSSRTAPSFSSTPQTMKVCRRASTRSWFRGWPSGVVSLSPMLAEAVTSTTWKRSRD
jgi:hypothetical protein